MTGYWLRRGVPVCVTPRKLSRIQPPRLLRPMLRPALVTSVRIPSNVLQPPTFAPWSPSISATVTSMPGLSGNMETVNKRCVDPPPAPAGHGLAGVRPHEPHTELLLAGLRPALVTLVQPQVGDGQAPHLQI